MIRETPDRSPRRERGFSLIEALAAGVLVLVVMVAVLPLFTRSAIDNVSGKESSIVSTHGKWTLEELYQLPLDRDDLLLAVGVTQEDNCATWDPEARAWNAYICGDPLPAGTAWSRTSSLRQYSISDVLDDGQLNNPIAGGTPPEFVHLRELAVFVEGERGGVLGPSRSMDLVTLRGF